MTVRRAAVTKPLLAVSSVVAKGGEVHFTPQRSWIKDSKGYEEDLEVSNGVYNLPVYVQPPQ